MEHVEGGDSSGIESGAKQPPDSVSAAIPQSDVTVTTDSVHDDEYEAVTVYLHKSTGYYYDPRTNQYLVPMSSHYTEQDTSYQPTSTTHAPSTTSEHVTADPGSNTDLCTLTSQSGEEDHVQKLVNLEKEFQGSQTKKDSQSISSMLASVSERVMERCGLEFEEQTGMYYQGANGLFYDQETRLYFDPDRGCYYDYDPVARQYSMHSRVTPVDSKAQRAMEIERKKKRKDEVVDLCSSSSDELDSPEEGELRSPKRPHLPKGSPPPEDEWAPCVRVLVTDSDCLPRASLYIVTVDGVNIGREPEGPNVIKIPELPVSKTHATLRYDKHKHLFAIQDQGSANGTFVNSERLSEPKEYSELHSLEHGDTLTLGSTTLSLHIHTGREICDWCDPVWLNEWKKKGKQGNEEMEGRDSLDLKRRKESNRIKKKYGLRIKDMYKQPSVTGDDYEDRAAQRRKTVGSDLPELQYPDSTPSSVDRPISDTNRGRQLLLRMGWSEGAGLGKSEQGRTNPVQAQMRDPKSGLGADESLSSLNTAGDESSTAIKSKRMRKRFNEVISRVV